MFVNKRGLSSLDVNYSKYQQAWADQTQQNFIDPMIYLA